MDNHKGSMLTQDHMESHQYTGKCLTWVDMSNSSSLSARVSRTFLLRVSGADMRRIAPELGDTALAGEWDDTTLRCIKLPSGLRGDGVAAAVNGCT